MNSRRLEGVAGNQSSSSGDEGGGCDVRKRKRKPPTKKKHIKDQKYVLHHENLCANTIELHNTPKIYTVIPLDDSMTEAEIRAVLVERFRELTGINSFRFFTKGVQGFHFCPCSETCIDPEHQGSNIEEWNARNTKKMARGHKVVYLHRQPCTIQLQDQVAVNGKGETQSENGSFAERTRLTSERTATIMKQSQDSAYDAFQTGNSATLSVATAQRQEGLHLGQRDEGGASSMWEQARGEPLPDLMMKYGVLFPDHEGIYLQVEDTSEQNFAENDRLCANDNEPRGRLTGGTATITRIGQDSAYETLQTGSTTSIFPPMDVAQGSEISPLLSPGTAERAMQTQRFEERAAFSVTIEEIAPTEGSVEGGSNFLITLEGALDNLVGQVRVLFGDLPAESVMIAGDRVSVKGKVPPSSTPGVVQVRVLNAVGERTISSNTVPFEYTEKRDKYKEERRRQRRNYLDGELNTSEDCLEMMSLLFERMRNLELKSKDGASCNGNEKTRALSHLRMIVETAAKINAKEFFYIIFSTTVGRNVFKSFKDEKLQLEEVARENGHEELACFLEQKHLMYKDDESDSDDEVDWESLAKAVKTFQRQNDWRKTRKSTESFEDSYDYNGDVEDSLSLMSEDDHNVEIFFEETFEEQETNSLAGNYQEDANTINPEESLSQPKCSLPALTDLLIGRDVECEEVIVNFVLNELRVGVIYGSCGIGKSSVAIEVGHKLLKKGWTVNYHSCNDLQSFSKISTLFTNLYQVPYQTTLLENDKENEGSGSHPSLLILDQVENLVEDDESADSSRVFQAFLDATVQASSLRLLFVSHKRISITDDRVFEVNIGSLSNAAAIQLLQNSCPASLHGDLSVIAKGCGCNPLAIMIVRTLLQNGVLETVIISEMSSPEHFWKNLLQSVENCHLVRESETTEAQSDNWTLPPSSLAGIQSTVQMQMFLDSWIEEENFLDEDVKSYDPRYCHCKLCTSSDESKSLKLALSLATSLTDLTQGNGHAPAVEQELRQSKFKNQRVGCLDVVVRGIKFLGRICLEKKAFFDVKETLKKAKEGAPRIHINKRASLDEKRPVTPPVSNEFSDDKQPVENPDILEGTPQDCSYSFVNAGEEITAAPPVLDELPSSLKKKTKLHSTCVVKRPMVMTVLTLFVVMMSMSSIAVCIVQLARRRSKPRSSLYRESEINAVTVPALKKYPAVNFTTLKPKQNTSWTTNSSFPGVICESKNDPDCSRLCHTVGIEIRNLATGGSVCIPCSECPPGYKLSVPCGGIVNKGVRIECMSCPVGYTFSSHYGRCQQCSQCQPDETVVRPCSPTADAVCARCGTNAITWVDLKKEIYACITCLICSAGFEPSHPCGSTVPHDTMITCIPCKKGETFSPTGDRKKCKRCSSCPHGQRVVVQCTTIFDTVCARPCRGEQYTLVSRFNNETKVECIKCLTCPRGMEPSMPCGAVFRNDVTLSCVLCRPGLTFSDRPSKYKCKRCTVCPPGNVVVSNCSIGRDTICSKTCLLHKQITVSNTTCIDCVECSVGMEPAIRCGSSVPALPRQRCAPCKPGTFSNTYGSEPCWNCRICHRERTLKSCTPILDSVCRPLKVKFPVLCSTCCNDGNDSFPIECRHLKWRKCQPRICLKIGSPPPLTGRFNSTMSIPESITSEILVFQPPKEVDTKPSNVLAVIFMCVGIIAIIILTAAIAYRFKRSLGNRLLVATRLRGRTAEACVCSEWVGETNHNRRTSKRLCDVVDEITLEELDAKHLELFDWMCRKLDRRRLGSYPDYVRLARCFDAITPEQCEYLTSTIHHRSPSRILMETLQVMYPNLTVNYLVQALKKIRCYDIADRLTDLIEQYKGSYRSTREVVCV